MKYFEPELKLTKFDAECVTTTASQPGGSGTPDTTQAYTEAKQALTNSGLSVDIEALF